MSGDNGIPFMDMQYYYDTAEKKEKPVVPITSREYGASSSKTTVTGLTDLYAVRLSLDGFPPTNLGGRQGDFDHAAGFQHRRPGQGR